MSSDKTAFRLMEMMYQLSFSVGKIMAGISWKKLPVRFCSNICSILPTLGGAHLPSLHPFSPSAGLREAWISPIPSLHLPGISQHRSKDLHLPRIQGEEKNLLWTQDLLFIHVVTEGAPRPQIPQQYLLWLCRNMRSH